MNSEIGTVATTGSQTRNNALYSPKSARLSWIDITRDLPYRFTPKPGDPESGYSALAAAATHYNGNVRVRLPDGELRVLKKIDDGVWDNFIWQADGTQERCDDDGKTNPALEYAIPIQGTVALPDLENGPIAVQLPQASDIAFDILWGTQVKLHTHGFGRNNKVILRGTVPARSSGRLYIRTVETPGYDSAARGTRAYIDDKLVVDMSDARDTAPSLSLQASPGDAVRIEFTNDAGMRYPVADMNIDVQA